ncbi:DUF362 domain-containing protein [Cloacibacillus porcorum]|uniref:DUF362 domain-containing protein n=1 Tax=Cloacibacillus porcorum TaxID=1197717 RepID=UPI0023F20671|nr:DUF362 domain-containing protein [Cloacibacillus porcorum]MDD7649026.1 DUF362 domain-containing protein [Cloacibacillus porcorum]MDY4094527.1 DUF362 domain-containing protein [Cloacibacillus porcorum]
MKYKKALTVIGMLISAAVLTTYGCVTSKAATPAATASSGSAVILSHNVDDDSTPVVYYTRDASSAGLLKIYEALGQKQQGKTGIKLTFESPGADHLDPKMLKPLVDKVHGTFLDSNGFSSPRNTTASHLRLAEEHGFSAVGPVDILDSDGELDLPVSGGKHLKYHRTGSHFSNYDTLISIVHFKPHSLRDYGGTIKNLSICLASTSGKAIIHSAGANASGFRETDMDSFMESMADAAKAAMDYKKGRWVFINVLNNIKVNDSCSDAKNLPDIGIIASSDPVAVDRAALDFTYGTAPDNNARQRWEDRHNTKVLEYAERLGTGYRKYRLVSLD